MKKYINLVLVILFANHSVYSQKSYSQIIGSWRYMGFDNKETESIECPDLIVFNKDGKYFIFNECYGKKIENPLVERGIWEYYSNEEIIILKNRQFATNYAYHNTNKVLKLYLKGSTKKHLKICYNKGKCNKEKYEKVKTTSNLSP
ncbi:MAG: hypothetical protein ACEQSR_05760 [Candidatus Methylacidiphilales bacterium]